MGRLPFGCWFPGLPTMQQSPAAGDLVLVLRALPLMASGAGDQAGATLPS